MQQNKNVVTCSK